VANSPHPFAIDHLPEAQQLSILRELTAQLWDQVWWMNLPEEKRKEYESQGFTAPIQNFYKD